MKGQHSGNNVIILMAEDDDGHAELIIEHLREAGVQNEIRHFHDGREVLDFFYGTGSVGPAYQTGQAYLLLLDIRMPKVSGTEVLRQLKADDRFRKLPVIMVTTTDDPREISSCHALGCNVYVTKPVVFSAFADALRRLGLFLLIIRVPEL
jgi:CheY-like chemotaxis protein